MSLQARISSAIVILALFSPGSTFAQEAATSAVAPETTAELAQVTAAMQSLVDENKVAGAVAIVSHRGKTILFAAVGSRDVSAGQPMQLRHDWRRVG